MVNSMKTRFAQIFSQHPQLSIWSKPSVHTIFQVKLTRNVSTWSSLELQQASSVDWQSSWKQPNVGLVSNTLQICLPKPIRFINRLIDNRVAKSEVFGVVGFLRKPGVRFGFFYPTATPEVHLNYFLHCTRKLGILTRAYWNGTTCFETFVETENFCCVRHDSIDC